MKYSKNDKIKEDKKLNWKLAYHQILMQTFDQIETTLRKLIIRCFINDTLVHFQDLQLHPPHSTGLPPTINNENNFKVNKVLKN